MKELLNLAFDAYDAGAPDQAAEFCYVIIQQDPENYGANYLLGSLCAERKDLIGAHKHLTIATQNDKTDKGLALFNLALIETQLQNFDAATLTLKQFLARFPQDIKALLLKTEIALRTGNPQEALIACEHALKVEPDNAEIVANYAIALQKTHQTHLARKACLRALELDATRAETYLLKSSLDYELLDFKSAISAASKAIKLNPMFHDAFYMRGIMKLLLNHYDTGWSDYEHRLNIAWIKEQSFKHQSGYLETCLRAPTPTTLRGKKIILIEEQGLGDTIMFSSLLPDLLQLTSEVEAFIDERLLAIMQTSFPVICFRSILDLKRLETKPHDHIVFMGSLCHAFRRFEGDFSGLPYLTLPPNSLNRWRSFLQKLPGKKIGLSWRGGMATTNASGRSIPLNELRGLLQDHRLSFVVLQHDARTAEIEALRAMTTNHITVLPRQDLEDMAEMGGLIHALDDIVTAQNTNVHLAGALGCPCKVIMPVMPTWSYGAEGAAMRWYKTIKLYRQSASDDLKTVITRLHSELI